MGEDSKVPDRMNVWQKLQTARLKLQAMELKKSGHNKFAGYYYFELGDFLPQTQALFNELGLCGTISFSAEYATLTVRDIDVPEQTIVFQSPMAEAQLKGAHPIQNLGAVETYQRRYLWICAMEIVEHDALDAVTGLDDPAPKAKPKAMPKPEPQRFQQPEPTGPIGELELDEVLEKMQGAINHAILVDITDRNYKRGNKEQKLVIKNAYDSIVAATGWGA